MIVLIGVAVGGLIMGYAIRGLIGKELKTVGTDAKSAVNTVASDITKKL